MDPAAYQYRCRQKFNSATLPRATPAKNKIGVTGGRNYELGSKKPFSNSIAKVKSLFKKEAQELDSVTMFSKEANKPSEKKALARVPVLIEALINLNAKESEGIFRLSGNHNADVTINKLIDENKDIPETDINILATALKKNNERN